MLPHRPRAVLFDLDGTLIDSEREVQAALALVLQQHGRPLSQDERDFVIGHAWGEIYGELCRHGPVPLPLPELEEAVFAQRKHWIEQEGRIGPLPGAVESVRLTSAHLPVGLVTGSSRPEALLALSVLGLRSCFTAVCCAGDYRHGKPAPDPYLLGAQLLEVPPEQCLAVEDSTPGIASARAAGLLCVAVRAGNFASQDQSAAHLILNDLTELGRLLESG